MKPKQPPKPMKPRTWWAIVNSDGNLIDLAPCRRDALDAMSFYEADGDRVARVMVTEVRRKKGGK